MCYRVIYCIRRFIYVLEITGHLVIVITSISPRGIRGVAIYNTKSKYNTTMHSVALVSGSPSIAITAFSRAGSPKPSTTVTRTEKETRSAARITGSEAILTEWCVYHRGEAVCVSEPRGHGTPPVSPHRQPAGAAFKITVNGSFWLETLYNKSRAIKRVLLPLLAVNASLCSVIMSFCFVLFCFSS